MADKHYLQKELYTLLKEDESIFDFIQNYSLDGLWYWNLEKMEDEWMDPKFWAVLGYDHTKMPHKSSAWQDIINPEDLKVAIENTRKHMENPDHPYDQIVRYTHKNGSTVWIQCRGVAIRDADGKPIRMIGAHNNITEIKNTELELKNALDSKNVLLKEIHHRVKNNLQVITSLLALQAGTIEDQVLKSCFQESQSRIDSMALVHEMLYQSDDLGNINYNEYLLELVNNLMYSASGNDHSINLHIETNNIYFNLNTSIPLGLLINEIITNSLKYAFDKNESGTLSIVMHEINATNYVMEIGDNGRGFSEDDQQRSNSIGLKLISKLCMQLNGSIKKDLTKKGTNYEIHFQKLNYES
ncbi:MAG: PAS domain-containing protein [Flavobacteriales bacterium]|nr:PAS domain-containing protein [Flavobacteriales bacterium]